MTAGRKLATYDDLLARPDDQKCEILGGELVIRPSASFSHVKVQGGPPHNAVQLVLSVTKSEWKHIEPSAQLSKPLQIDSPYRSRRFLIPADIS